MQIYQNLEMIRKKNNKTQKEIADILNTTQQQYSKYEKGLQELPIRHLITLAKHYNLTTDQIIGLKNTELIISEEIISIINLYNKLNERRKGRIEQLLIMLADEQAEENATKQETA